MTLRHAVLSAIIATLSVGSSGCLFRKAKPTVAPVTTAPAPVAPAPAPQPDPTPPPQTNPEPEPAPQLPQTNPAPVNPQPVTPQPTAPPRSPRPRNPQPQTVPSPAPTAPAPAPAPPAFGELLSPDQQARLLRAYEQSSQAARRALNQAAGHHLNRDQTDTANRVRSFLKQAEESRVNDPSTAAQLAHRAELLANSLVGSLQ